MDVLKLYFLRRSTTSNATRRLPGPLVDSQYKESCYEYISPAETERLYGIKMATLWAQIDKAYKSIVEKQQNNASSGPFLFQHRGLSEGEYIFVRFIVEKSSEKNNYKVNAKDVRLLAETLSSQINYLRNNKVVPHTDLQIIYGVSRRTIINWIKSGKIPWHKVPWSESMLVFADELPNLNEEQKRRLSEVLSRLYPARSADVQKEERAVAVHSRHKKSTNSGKICISASSLALEVSSILECPIEFVNTCIEEQGSSLIFTLGKFSLVFETNSFMTKKELAGKLKRLLNDLRKFNAQRVCVQFSELWEEKACSDEFFGEFEVPMKGKVYALLDYNFQFKVIEFLGITYVSKQVIGFLSAAELIESVLKSEGVKDKIFWLDAKKYLKTFIKKIIDIQCVELLEKGNSNPLLTVSECLINMVNAINSEKDESKKQGLLIRFRNYISALNNDVDAYLCACSVKSKLSKERVLFGSNNLVQSERFKSLFFQYQKNNVV